MSARTPLVRTTIALAALLLATFAVSLTTPGAAQARCKGEGVRVNSTLIISGSVYVTERPNSGTCNGNRGYRATYETNRSGWSAFVCVNASPGNQPWVCTSPTSSSFGYGVDNVTAFWMVLCTTNFTTTRCGFGSNYRTSFYPDVNTTYDGLSWGV